MANCFECGMNDYCTMFDVDALLTELKRAAIPTHPLMEISFKMNSPWRSFEIDFFRK